MPTRFKVGSRSPWGAIDSLTEYHDGTIIFVGTPSHGGFHLTKARLMEMHPALAGLAEKGWFEEDCKASAVIVSFSHSLWPHDGELAARNKANAEETLMNWYPDEYEAAFAVVIPTEKSFRKRERALKEANFTNFVVKSAWGSWHDRVPDGYVGVLAVRQSDEAMQGFLVPASEYKTRSNGGGFVIDTNNHIPWEVPS